MVSMKRRRERAACRVEETATHLIYCAEYLGISGQSLYDSKDRRQSLLTAARRYAYAVKRLMAA